MRLCPARALTPPGVPPFLPTLKDITGEAASFQRWFSTMAPVLKQCKKGVVKTMEEWPESCRIPHALAGKLLENNDWVPEGLRAGNFLPQDLRGAGCPYGLAGKYGTFQCTLSEVPFC